MKLFRILVLSSLIALLTGCTAEVQLTQQKDGIVDVQFKGSAGEAFKKMVQTASGTEETIFDIEAINYELTKSGFSNVNVNANNTDISVSMKDGGKSFLFTSDLVQTKDKSIFTTINKNNLYSFYALADEQLAMVLDLLLAPVFNDEEMSEGEYLELLSSFYGEAIAQELKESVVKITLIGEDGKKAVQTIPMAKILCIAEEISLHSSN